MSRSEEDLINRAQAGDHEAFCLLAESYQRRVYVLALHYCRDSSDAEDLSQEVWLKAFRALGQFRGESSFYTWLRHIIINSFLNHRRAAARRRTDASAAAVSFEALDETNELAQRTTGRVRDAEGDIHAKILLERVLQALGELTPQQRLIFLLKHREGMTYEEIAQAFGCSTGTIKKALFRAVVKLRQRLGVEATAAEYEPCAAGENL
ncbi:MAG TPA: sigma-70 family RNA polymerase sigma factor [Pyrinomonadaceae bacterium]